MVNTFCLQERGDLPNLLNWTVRLRLRQRMSREFVGNLTLFQKLSAMVHATQNRAIQLNQTKLIHSVMVTAANVHDKHALPNLLHGQEGRVYADAGYAGQQDMINEIAPEARAFVNARAYGGKKLTDRQKERSRKKSRIRALVEDTFSIIKRGFKYTNVRYRGLHKDGTRAFVACALANQFMVRGHLLRTQLGVVRPRCGGKSPSHRETQ